MELTCDKIEDFMLNKYIRGSFLSSKCEYKEENVKEILYFLHNPKKLTSDGDIISPA